MAGYFELFWSFFKIGSFTLGGGFAMIPLMEKELVQQKQWLSKEEFLDLLSVSQAMPGVFAVNMATSIGYRLRGKTGAIMSVLGNILMPILTILALAMFFRYFRGNAFIESIFKGIRPCVVALIAAPVFTMAKSAGLNWRNCWIPILAAVLIWLLGVSPVLIIIIAGLGGFLYGRFINKKEAAA
ncbi:MAG: chromate transporter [Bacteroidales bacterium]|nr:chromate transporter [Bacteroidales bacterium]